MKTKHILWLFALLLLVAAGCGSDDGDDPTPPVTRTDNAVLADAWTAYGIDDWAEAEVQFRELLGRGTRDAEAHDGLGWNFAAQSQVDSALVHFQEAVDADAEASGIGSQAQAGLAFAAAAALEFQDCLDAAAEVSSSWVFAHGSDIDHDAVVVLEAVAHYALGEFADALAAVQQLDPGFVADVENVDGRAALAARIEELQA